VDELPSPYPAYQYGACGCGDTFEAHLVEVRLTVEDQAIVLRDVPQGACPTCGSRVYKAEILELIEAIFHGDLPLQTAPDPAPVVSTS